jgi:addiction module RelB/DinJ family antitoxin
MDENLRKEADLILEELGLNMSAAVNIFVKQLVRQGGLPFTPSLETNRTTEKRRQERLYSLLNFAKQHNKIESDYVFERDDYYER